MSIRLRTGAAVGCVLVCIAGCSDDGNDICATPDFWLEVMPGSATVEVGDSLALRAMFCSISDAGVTWYVNHAPGGNSEVGTITEIDFATHTAIYTAPYQMPYPEAVSVMAVFNEYPARAAGCDVTITHNTVHVSVNEGDDETGTGARTRPVRTITRGVEIAGTGTKVSIASGTYTEDTGETFPIVLTDGITLVGESRDDVSLGDTVLTHVEIAGADCSVRRLYFYHGRGTAIHATGTAERTRIDSVRTWGEFAVLIDGARDTVLRDCWIVSNKKCPCGRGIEMVGGDTGTAIKGCRVEGFEHAAYLDSSSNALIEDCIFGTNYYDVYLCHKSDPEGSPNPDLGGGARGSAGRNEFWSHGRPEQQAAGQWGCLLTNLTTNTIYARNNTWSAYPPVEGTDFCNPNGGQVIW